MANAKVLFASGKTERAIGQLQALLEYGLFSPQVQGPGEFAFLPLLHVYV